MNNTLPECFKIRIRNEEHSRLVQEWLFNNGCYWVTGEKDVSFTFANFLYVRNGSLTFSDDVPRFEVRYASMEEVAFDIVVQPRVIEKPKEVNILGKTYIIKDTKAFEEALKSAGVIEKGE